MSSEFNSAVTFFISTFTELTFLFMTISFVIGILNEKLPPERIKQLLSGNQGYGIAVTLGALTPFCSCSTIPMTIGLIKSRAPFGPIMAFLFTSPLLNPFVVGLFWLAFGIKVTLIYSSLVILLASVSGYLLEKFHFQRFIKTDLFASNCTEKLNNNEQANKETMDLNDFAVVSVQKSHQELKKILLETGKQFISFSPYMVFGVLVGALLHGYIPQSTFEELEGVSVVMIIPLAAIIGVFLYVRASTMIPIASALIAKGMALGAVISLTIAGAGASLPEMIMMKRMFHWPLMFCFILVVIATACITGFAIELI